MASAGIRARLREIRMPPRELCQQPLAEPATGSRRAPRLPAPEVKSAIGIPSTAVQISGLTRPLLGRRQPGSGARVWNPGGISDTSRGARDSSPLFTDSHYI